LLSLLVRFQSFDILAILSTTYYPKYLSLIRNIILPQSAIGLVESQRFVKALEAATKDIESMLNPLAEVLKPNFLEGSKPIQPEEALKTVMDYHLSDKPNEDMFFFDKKTFESIEYQMLSCQNPPLQRETIPRIH